MTKHRDVNKCKRQEKYKMAALSGKLTSGYEMANKPKTKKERMHGEKEGERREKTITTLSQKKEEAINVSEQRDKGWIHVIPVHDTTHLAVTTTRQGNRRSLTTPHKERMRGALNIETTPLTRSS